MRTVSQLRCHALGGATFRARYSRLDQANAQSLEVRNVPRNRGHDDGGAAVLGNRLRTTGPSLIDELGELRFRLGDCPQPCAHLTMTMIRIVI